MKTQSFLYRLFLIHVFSLLIILLMFFVNAYYSKREAAVLIASSTRNLLLSGNYRDAIVLINLQSKNNFSKVSYGEDRKRQIFEFDIENKVYLPSLSKEVRVPVSLSGDSESKEVLLFTFHYDLIVAKAFLLWLVLFVLSFPIYIRFIRRIKMEYELSQERDRALALATLASQVSHDIRSPLAALDMSIKDLSELPEERRAIVRNSIARIHDIANNLLVKNRASKNLKDFTNERIPPILVSGAIESILSEKREQYRSKLGIRINFDSNSQGYGLFSRFDLSDFKRILSNLVNNSVEAFEKDSGIINLNLSSDDDHIYLCVADNGKGVSREVLSSLGKKGQTHGKKDGNGLGLYHARTTLESWGGGLKIESTLGVGTTITLTFLKEKVPAWFIEKLTVRHYSRIVVIDDDSSVHHVWDGRFQSLQLHLKNIEVIHLSTPMQAEEWILQNKDTKETIYLVDFEFSYFEINGLDLIEKLHIQKNAILVTSRYEEDHILKRCMREGIYLLPKNLSSFIPIEITGEEINEQFSYVYIEDDFYLRSAWEIAAKKKGIKLLLLESPKEFERYLDKISKEKTLIYIDSDLGKNEAKGEDFAKTLHERGFKNLFLATGYEASDFAHLPWLKFAGKDCPFEEDE